jgi:two-component system, OmpR family, sensor kinase
MRLRRRLTVAMAVLLVIGLAITDVVTYTSLRSFLYGRLDDQLDASQRLTARFLEHAASKHFFPTAGRLGDRVSQEVYVILLSPTGKVLLRKPSGSTLNPNPPPILPRSLRLSPEIATASGPYRPNPADFTLVSSKGSRYRAQASSVPQGTLITATPLAQTEDTLSSLVRIEGGVSVAVLLALCALALWTVRRGLRPLYDMAETANAIASGDLSRRVEPSGGDSEVGRLGTALNGMLTQIEMAFAETSASAARLRQFVADASHELRTPLTSIRGYAELLRKGAFPQEEERLRALRRVEHEAARMGGLVDDLLLLARLDQGRPLERTPVDLRRICRDAVDDVRMADPDRSVELVAPDRVTVAGDRDRIAQMAHNLVRNAVVHTPPGSAVSVQVRTDGPLGVVRVIDDGPGLTPMRLARVFDRFYRADPARTGEGTGLGLSIVRAIAEALGGRAWAEPRVGGGTVFSVAIPLWTAEDAPSAADQPPRPADQPPRPADQPPPAGQLQGENGTPGVRPLTAASTLPATTRRGPATA